MTLPRLTGNTFIRAHTYVQQNTLVISRKASSKVLRHTTVYGLSVDSSETVFEMKFEVTITSRVSEVDCGRYHEQVAPSGYPRHHSRDR